LYSSADFRQKQDHSNPSTLTTASTTSTTSKRAAQTPSGCVQQRASAFSIDTDATVRGVSTAGCTITTDATRKNQLPQKPKLSQHRHCQPTSHATTNQHHHH
jgi:hypothetical protein